jgi:uncharacterized protein
LGVRYDIGRGVPQDDKEAVKWYRLAADQGHALGQANLGTMYDKGRGVPQDDKEAVKWYRLAADQGNVLAQTNLGLMYDKGRGVSQDYIKASEWYMFAANQGQADAQNNLGAIFVEVVHDWVVGYALFSLAMSQGHEQAADSIKKNEQQMSRQDIERALELSRQMNRPGQLSTALKAYLDKTNSVWRNNIAWPR